jgi:predicted ArsR family transcriptional regulator
MPRQFDDAEIDALLAQGTSINQTAKQLGIPPTTLKRHLNTRKHVQEGPQINQGLPESTSAPSVVYPRQPMSTTQQDPSHLDELCRLLPALREITREWMEHRQTMQVNLSQPKSTVRWTYHLDARLVQAVKDYAKLHRLSESAVANLALQQFFQSRQIEQSPHA